MKLSMGTKKLDDLGGGDIEPSSRKILHDSLCTQKSSFAIELPFVQARKVMKT